MNSNRLALAGLFLAVGGIVANAPARLGLAESPPAAEAVATPPASAPPASAPSAGMPSDAPPSDNRADSVRSRPLPAASFQYDHGQFVIGRIEQTLQESADLRGRRLEDLRDQLEALRMMMETRAAATQPPAADPATPAKDGSGNPNTGDATAAEPETAAAKAFEAVPLKPLSTSPIDRLALANNLFASGQYGLALESYRQLNPESLTPSDHRWARYQMACCYRKLGNPTDAEEIYRELASATTEDFISHQARWWLDRMQKRQRLEASLKGIDDALKSLESQIHGGSNGT
ncbi:MAG: hypothetical protein R3C99_18485 [Pirellulaceae bacterium]